MSYKIFARKYRPQAFEEVIGQKSVVRTIQNAIQMGRISQAYLFSGMRGTGKTSVARILARALNCVNGPTASPCKIEDKDGADDKNKPCDYCAAISEDRAIDVLEIDGASNRGIDEIRALRESMKYKAIYTRYKVVIIDEVHQITKEGFNALLKTLEEPPPNTVFIFATTEFNKVPATIVSRCQHFEFRKISHKDIINHLVEIARREAITITPVGLAMIAEAADGSMRDAQSLLDQAVAFSGENIGDEDLKTILGTIGQDVLFRSSTAVLEEKPEDVFPLIESVVAAGYDLRFLFGKLIEHFRALLLVRSVEKPEDLLLASAEELQALRVQASKATAEDLLRYLLALQQAEAGLKYSAMPRIYLEAFLIKLCHFRKIVPLQELIRDVDSLRKESPRTLPKPAGNTPAGAPPAGGTGRSVPAGKPPAGSLTAEKTAPSAPKDVFKRVLEKLATDRAP
ncbi:MAG: DNA polymerase III subunit gamma/tau, partial [Candidatus Aminicenantes bacterium]|nr:DNA polymerase III subunit gamma/tau [Candidatus Aminicenantes bacterium]